MAKGFWDLSEVSRRNTQRSEAPCVAGKGQPVGAAARQRGPHCPQPRLPVRELSAAPRAARLPPARLLHLVQVVGAAVVDVMAQAGGHHGKGLQVRVVALQFAGLKGTGAQGPAACQHRSPPRPRPSLLGVGGKWGGHGGAGPEALPLPKPTPTSQLEGCGLHSSAGEAPPDRRGPGAQSLEPTGRVLPTLVRSRCAGGGALPLPVHAP